MVTLINTKNIHILTRNIEHLQSTEIIKNKKIETKGLNIRPDCGESMPSRQGFLSCILATSG